MQPQRGLAMSTQYMTGSRGPEAGGADSLVWTIDTLTEQSKIPFLTMIREVFSSRWGMANLKHFTSSEFLFVAVLFSSSLYFHAKKKVDASLTLTTHLLYDSRLS